MTSVVAGVRHAVAVDLETSDDAGARRRRLVRGQRDATIAVVVLGVVSAFWLAALSEPGNVTGVLLLEGMTAVPLMFVLWRRRRIGQNLRLLPAHDQPPVSRDREPALAVGPPLRFDSTRRRDLTLRPRLIFQVLAVMGSVGGLVVLLKLSYDEAMFDPRIAAVAIYAVLYSVAATRAKVVVAGGVLWRRTLRSYQGVQLGELATVEVARARYLRQEGLIRTILRVTDRHGRTVALKPVLWTRGARSLLAGLSVEAQAQNVALDDRTARRLGRATSARPLGALSWDAPFVSHLDPEAVAARTSPKRQSTFWLRLDENGRPKKTQPQLVLPAIAVLALSLPAMLAVGHLGTRGIRALRCANERSLWTTPSDDDGQPAAPETIAQRIAASDARAGVTKIWTLSPDGMANNHNTAAVRRDALRLTTGFVVGWETARTDDAEVFIEEFETDAAATTFHRDYAEDHCHAGDIAFTPTGIPGGVGFRCRCAGAIVNDRVSFTRGATRVQVIVWAVSEQADHTEANELARAALHAAKL